jgi:hypothetical protein
MRLTETSGSVAVSLTTLGMAGVVGTVVPVASADALHRQMNELVDAAVAEGGDSGRPPS